MRTYFFTTPVWLKWFYPHRIWQIPGGEKELFLTFDDGPVPEVTGYVLDLLDQYEAKATFFCVGTQLEQFPQWKDDILSRGHWIGNHTHQHLNGWKTKNELYLRDVSRCDKLMDTSLFRPPYGRMRRSQHRQLTDKQVIMWSNLSGDFDPDLRTDRALRQLLKARNGNILVFHDALSAFGNLKKLLPPVLEHFTGCGYSFSSMKRLCD